jgi:hypothetical protein
MQPTLLLLLQLRELSLQNKLKRIFVLLFKKKLKICTGNLITGFFIHLSL